MITLPNGNTTLKKQLICYLLLKEINTDYVSWKLYWTMMWISPGFFTSHRGRLTCLMQSSFSPRARNPAHHGRTFRYEREDSRCLKTAIFSGSSSSRTKSPATLVMLRMRYWRTSEMPVLTALSNVAGTPQSGMSSLEIVRTYSLKLHTRVVLLQPILSAVIIR